MSNFSVLENNLGYLVKCDFWTLLLETLILRPGMGLKDLHLTQELQILLTQAV